MSTTLDEQIEQIKLTIAEMEASRMRWQSVDYREAVIDQFELLLREWALSLEHQSGSNSSR